MKLIRPNTCSTCAFRYRDINPPHETECRLNPPSTQVIISMGPKGPSVMGHISQFTKVQPDWWCHKFAAMSPAPVGMEAPLS